VKSLRKNRWPRTGHRPVLARGGRPSPAMIIALIALFVSLSGVSYGVATGFIDSREIKNNEIRSRDIRNNEVRSKDLRNNEVRGLDIRNSTIQGRDIAINAVRGEDVSEDTLAKVPSALLADRAGTAGAADSVGGVTLRRISYSEGQAVGTGTFAQVLNFGGLKLEARCNNGPVLQVRANPAAANAELSWVFNTGAPYDFDLDFDPGDNTLVASDAAPGPGLISFAGSDGRVVTVHAQPVQNPNDVRGTTDDCGFFGIAEAG
jgi:hypothetical protein